MCMVTPTISDMANYHSPLILPFLAGSTTYAVPQVTTMVTIPWLPLVTVGYRVCGVSMRGR